MTHPRLLLSIVDDDESVRESLPDLLHELGYTARAFSSAEEFLASQALDESKCLILDVSMTRMSGPDLQRELKRRGKALPIIFITANRNEAMRSQVLAEGAAECLYKPFSDTALLTAIHSALEKR
jgi:FixJ family two-component response regulator